jgi:tRNA (cmo5U34)-methyltransferase
VSLSTENAFSSTAALYDLNRSRLIPGFEGLYRWAVDLVPNDATQILDLGAGTGLLAALIRARFPDASLHLIDLSAAMLAKARERFEGDTRTTFEVADYSVAALQGRYNAVVSALSIHHLEDDAKRALFDSIMNVLLPGGVFVNAEQVMGSTPALEERYKREWLHKVRALGATEQQISDSLFRQQEDRCASVEDQMAWMRSAGFSDVDCWFKDGRFATLAGTKPR